MFHANGKGKHTGEDIEDLYHEFILQKDFQCMTVTDLITGTQQTNQ